MNCDKYLVQIPIWAIRKRDTADRYFCRMPIGDGAVAFPLFTAQDAVTAAAWQYSDKSGNGMLEPIAIDSLQALVKILADLERSGTPTVVVDPRTAQVSDFKIYPIRHFIENVERQLPHDEPDEDPVHDDPGDDHYFAVSSPRS